MRRRQKWKWREESRRDLRVANTRENSTEVHCSSITFLLASEWTDSLNGIAPNFAARAKREVTSMWDDFISRQIRRTNRNLLLIGAGILTVLGLLLTAGWRDTYNFIFGPFPVQNSQLVAISSPDAPKHYFLKVRGAGSFATGMREVDAGNHDKIRAEVVALVVEKRLLLVKTPADNHQLEFTGILTAVPAELLNDLVRKEEAKNPELKGAFLPFMLDATGFRKGDNLWVAIAGAGFGLLGVFLTGLSLRRQLQP